MNPTKRDLARRTADLTAGDPHDGEIYVVAIGGDPNRPRGWLTRDEYEEHYGDSCDPTEFEWHYKPGR